MGEWMTNAMTIEEMHSLCADLQEDWSLECSMPLSAGTGMGTGDITIHLCRSDEFIPKKKAHLGAFVSLATTTKDSGSLSNHSGSTDFSQSINICDGDNTGMGNATCSALSGHSPRAAWPGPPGGVEAYCFPDPDLCSLSHSFNDGYHRGCLEVPWAKCAPGPFASMAQDHVARVSVNPASMMKQSLVFKTPPLSSSPLNLRPRSKSPGARPSSPFKPGPRNDGAQCKTPARARKMDRGGDKNESNTVAEIKSKKCRAGSARSRKVPSKVKPRRMMNRPEHNHAKSATDVLKHWFASNLASPFPSEVIKNKLADQSGLSVAQVSNWFVNHRKRVLKPLRTAAGLPQLRNRLGKEFPTIPEPPRRKPGSH